MLDLNKPYGQTFGTGFNHVYVQDDKFFNAAYEEVNEEGEVIEEHKKRGRPSKTVTDNA